MRTINTLIPLHEMTYAESQNKPPFDWNAELQKKIDGSSDLLEAGTPSSVLIDLSGQWVSCAVGNKCEAIPRDEDGCPIDGELDELGMDFHAYICGKDWRAAQATLTKIEARSAEILATL